MYRINHLSWWKEELPSGVEYQTDGASLEKAGWEVDYIITHCCSTSVQNELRGGFYQADALTDFLDEVTRRCRFKYHFFGHYHMDRIIQKKTNMFSGIVRCADCGEKLYYCASKDYEAWQDHFVSSSGFMRTT